MMPFIRDYSRNQGDKEHKMIIPPRTSAMETALHEAIHVVILRIDGLDITDVIDQDNAAWTRLVEPQKFTVAALMAPEVYMMLNNILFTDLSVSSDRDVVANCFCPEEVEDIRTVNQECLKIVFQCPYVRAAISVLCTRMHDELLEYKTMSGISIHTIIDPILIHSFHADQLRDKLSGQL